MSRRTFGLHARHVLAVYDRAPEDVRRAGRNWYANAVPAVGALLDGSPRWTWYHRAGVLAALSPRMPWERNVEMAALALSLGRAVGVLSANAGKANAIMALSPLLPPTELRAAIHDILRGPKTRSFFECCADPWGAHGDVCIDRHAVCIAAGRYLREQRGAAILARVGAYARAQDCYREAAARVGIFPLQMQAITWLQWRLEN